MYYQDYTNCVYTYLHAGIYAFVIEKDGVNDSEDEVIQQLRQLIRNQIGGFAVPEHFLVSAHQSISS